MDTGKFNTTSLIILVFLSNAEGQENNNPIKYRRSYYGIGKGKL